MSRISTKYHIKTALVGLPDDKSVLTLELPINLMPEEIDMLCAEIRAQVIGQMRKYEDTRVSAMAAKRRWPHREADDVNSL